MTGKEFITANHDKYKLILTPATEDSEYEQGLVLVRNIRGQEIVIRNFNLDPVYLLCTPESLLNEYDQTIKMLHRYDYAETQNKLANIMHIISADSGVKIEDLEKLPF